MPADPRDESHLETLKVCHYIYAGLGVVGLLFIIAHYAIMNAVFTTIAEAENAKNGAELTHIFVVFDWFYLIIGIWTLALMILNFFSAHALRDRNRSRLIMTTSGINCINIPLGTILGVFTLVVLTRSSVKILFESAKRI